MSLFKIIFTGPVGAGKTTAIAALSDTPPVSTDQVASDMARNRKETTTVAMDYGVMHLGSGESIHLYGTPGQERFDFMWDLLSEGGIGLVLLLDNTRADPFNDLQFFLNAFKNFIDRSAVVIGITQMDLAPTPTVHDYQQQLQGSGLKVPVFDVDARVRADVSLLIQALLYSLDPTLETVDG